jgi:hypothetical protein
MEMARRRRRAWELVFAADPNTLLQRLTLRKICPRPLEATGEGKEAEEGVGTRGGAVGDGDLRGQQDAEIGPLVRGSVVCSRRGAEHEGICGGKSCLAKLADLLIVYAP